ncbi:metabolite traffic protein EboE [Azospirillum sp. CT11-132]|uniref:metabolite traffic protein EboE n=1 Tax=Azospirillum sp. CT11-132 TaxID=3396317 RepID=UPI0039A4A340
MRLSGGGTLGYCLNVHPTQSFAEVRAALLGPVREIKRRLCPDRPFGVGLRLSAEAASEAGVAAELAAIFDGEGFAAFTMNGFPYGRFHGAPVKEAVYEPDWTTAERVAYSLSLAETMAALVPPGGFATISTVPGGYAPRVTGREAAVADGLLQAVAGLVRLEQSTGRTVALALEPEPWCLLDSTADAVTFFRAHLFTDAAARRLGALAGLTADEAAAALPRHLGLCLDVCHMAVNFEEPVETLAALAAAGIPIHKVQLSAALRIERADAVARERLAAFRDAVYLHQTVARAADGTAAGRLRRFVDLPQALESPGGEDEEWRVHFHVPVFAEPEPPLDSTSGALEGVLAIHRGRPVAPHLEVETYTWDVLPAEACGAGAMSVVDGIERELRWVLERLS